MGDALGRKLVLGVYFLYVIFSVPFIKIRQHYLFVHQFYRMTYSRQYFPPILVAMPFIVVSVLLMQTTFMGAICSIVKGMSLFTFLGITWHVS